MERLRDWSYRSIQRIETKFKRYLYNEIDWNNRLLILYGARGVGKTTIMLQYLKEKQSLEEEVLYVSLDDLYFANNSIIDLVEEFTQKGGVYLFLDEIQKYKNWAIEIKSIYDNFPSLYLVLSGSSSVEILKSESDLSRRALYYHLNGLSFREFINFKTGKNYKPYALDEVITNHKEISFKISEEIRPIKEFLEYTRLGYYPFFKEDRSSYHQRIRQVINTVIEVDIPSVYAVDFNAVQNIKKLLGIIAEIVPFKPNVKKLSEKIGISRESFTRYLKYLEKAEIVNLLYNESKGISLLNKPEKIYLNNSNINFALNINANIGNIRETFFINQLIPNHKVRFSEKGDFKVDDKYLFEVGGKNKNDNQIKGERNAWIVADDIDVSHSKKIPLWLFGFCY